MSMVGPRPLPDDEPLPVVEQGPPAIEHLVYFGDEAAANEFTREAERAGFASDAHESDDDEWAVILRAPYEAGDPVRMPEALAAAVVRLGGDVDGSGVFLGNKVELTRQRRWSPPEKL
jgi:hypothetical protein